VEGVNTGRANGPAMCEKIRNGTYLGHTAVANEATEARDSNVPRIDAQDK